MTVIASILQIFTAQYNDPVKFYLVGFARWVFRQSIVKHVM